MSPVRFYSSDHTLQNSAILYDFPALMQFSESLEDGSQPPAKAFGRNMIRTQNPSRRHKSRFLLSFRRAGLVLGLLAPTEMIPGDP